MPVIYTAEGVKPLPSDMMYGLTRAVQENENTRVADAGSKRNALGQLYTAAAMTQNPERSKALMIRANELSDQLNEERGGVYDQYGRRHENTAFAPGVSDPTGMAMREQGIRQQQGVNNRQYTYNKTLERARELEAKRRAGLPVSEQEMNDALNAVDVWRNITEAWLPAETEGANGFNPTWTKHGAASTPTPRMFYNPLTKSWMVLNPDPIQAWRYTLGRGYGLRIK